MATSESILIIDFDKATSRLYQREIGKFYNVVTCTSWSQGLEIVKNTPLSAIILDPYQPDNQGWLFLNDAVMQEQDIPIIICTTADATIKLSFPIRKYLIKPVLPTQLLAELDTVFLERRSHTK